MSYCTRFLLRNKIYEDKNCFCSLGGLNAQGCHAGSRPYHCHRSYVPTRSKTRSTSTVGDKECSDFLTWLEAQHFYEHAGPSGPHDLDTDNNGIACETLR